MGPVRMMACYTPPLRSFPIAVLVIGFFRAVDWPRRLVDRRSARAYGASPLIETGGRCYLLRLS